MDRVMRQWIEMPEEARHPGQMVSMVQEIMDREELAAVETGDGVVKWKNKADRVDTLAWCQELVRRLEPHLETLIFPYEYQSAKRFRAPVQIPYLTGEPTWITLAGEMDVLTRNHDDEFAIWDLKGTADDSYWRKTIGQLVFYDLATSAVFGKYAHRTGLIQPMCASQLVEIKITDQMRVEMMSRIIRMAHDIWQKDIRVKESTSGCAYCSVRHACEKWTPVNAGQNAKRMSLIGATVDLDQLLNLPVER